MRFTPSSISRVPPHRNINLYTGEVTPGPMMMKNSHTAASAILCGWLLMSSRPTGIISETMEFNNTVKVIMPGSYVSQTFNAHFLYP